MREEALIRFEKVRLGYDHRTILQDVDAVIKAGQFLGIVGPNGSGKTTLLRSILGWVKPKAGTISMRQGLRFGYVPQRNVIDSLYPLTAHDIVLMGLYRSRRPWQRITPENRESALKALDQVNLRAKASVLFSQLSGGQQQRALLARALVGRPDVLILDEPTNGMDLVSEATVMETVRRIHESTGMTIILVTHLLHVVGRHADHMGLIQDDRIEFGATTDLLTTQHLTQLYKTPINVSKLNGRTVIMAND